MSHSPKKRFGQHFLRDRQMIERILHAAALQPDDRVLEIGPGQGVLTGPLLERAGQVVVMEVDRDLAEGLRRRQAPNLLVHEGDALRMDWSQMLAGEPFKLVANLPYNISSQILFKILEHRQHFRQLVLMFQKEVGDRLCAPPDTRDYGILSVLCQLHYQIRRVALVPPGAFFPPPKVDSVVLLFEPLPAPRVPVVDEAFFRKVVKAAFAQRRKTLRNTLIAAGFDSQTTPNLLTAAGIDPGRRGETLTLTEFACMAEALRQGGGQA
jgi:16S rRNA (adenine1518-N6/adenine1519-N6)-dimethyltransferase